MSVVSPGLPLSNHELRVHVLLTSLCSCLFNLTTLLVLETK